MTVGRNACCSVLEPLQLQDVVCNYNSPNRAVVLEVRLSDAGIKTFTGRKCLAYLRKPIAREA